MILIIYFLRLAFIVATISFAALNAQLISINLYWVQCQAPLAQIVIISIIFGYLLKFVFPWLFFWKKRREIF